MASTFPTFEALMQRGRELSQHNRHEAAARSFGSSAMAAAKTEQRIDAIDLQIGALVKDKQLSDALKEAKLIIRINRRDPRGYIRAGQVERLLNCHTAAFQWYKHGLKHANPSHKHFGLLKAGISKCETSMKEEARAAKRRDPFISLPLEVARSILQYFDYREVTAMLRVSKSWGQFIRKEDILARTLDFSCARSAVSIKAFKAALRRLIQYPESVHLVNMASTARTDALGRLPSWFRKNTMKAYHSSILLDKTMLDSVPTDSILSDATIISDKRSVQGLLEKCKFLKRLTCRLRHRKDDDPGFLLEHEFLQELRLDDERGALFELSVSGLKTPSLRRLDLSWCNLGRELTSDISKMDMLKTLRLHGCNIASYIDFPHSIQELLLPSCSFRRDVAESGAVPSFPNLRTIQADVMKWSPFWVQAVYLSQSLEQMDIRDQNLVDAHAALVASMSSLKSIVIRYANRITGVFVKDLLDKANGRIESVKLVNCANVSSDTGVWARQNYGVSFHMSSDPMF